MFEIFITKIKQTVTNNLTLSALSGFALWFSFNHPTFWFFSLVGLVPLFIIIYKPNVSSWAKFFYGWLSAGIYALGFLVWHWNILPLDWIGINSYLTGSALIFYVWFLPAAVIGVIMGGWTVLMSWLKTHRWIDLPLFAFSWPFFEFIRSFAISVLWYGNGGILGPNWTIGFLGYVLSPGPFLSLATWGGVYLVGAMGVAVNFVLYQLVKDHRSKIWWGVVGGLFFIWLVSFINLHYFSLDSDKKAKLALVNTYEQSFSRISEGELGSFVYRKKAVLSSVIRDNNYPNLIIFPEDSRILSSYVVADNQAEIKNLLASHQALIIDSARLAGQKGFAKLTFQYLDSKTGTMVEDGKSFLVPNGEYMPYLTDFLGGVIGQSEWVINFRHTRETAPIIKQQEGIDFQGFRFRATACSEIMLPTVHSKIAAAGAPLLINTASHSLFRGSEVLYRQTISMAKMRAVENNRYFVAANNFIPNFIINNRGKLLKETEWDQTSILYASVPLITKQTLYSQIYPFVPWFLLFITLCLGFISRVKYAKIGLQEPV